MKTFFTFSKRFFILICLLSFLRTTALAQDNKESFYVFKKDMSPAKDMASATYFMHEVIENDTTYVCRFYQKTGPMMKMETFRDSALTIPHGNWAWYRTNGDVDTIGVFSNEKEDKYWRCGIKENGLMDMAEEYESGKLIKQTNFVAKKVWYKGEWLDVKESDLVVPVHIKNSNFALIDDRPAEYKDGGIAGWLQYLRENLKTPERFTLISGPRTKASIRLEFEVNETGKIQNVLIDHSREWSVDMAAMNIIKNSPPWVPAKQGGNAGCF